MNRKRSTNNTVPSCPTIPAITVTLAAYNAAPFVADCLDSILAQSHIDFELVIVDDASTDRTRAILQNYAARDGRIRLILKDQNAGLAVARNDAISVARGKWVTFLDADDLFHPDMLRKAYEIGERRQADVVLWDYLVFSETVQIPQAQTKPSDLDRIDPTDRLVLLNRPAFAWTRLVRRDILTRLDIRFAEGLTYQDVPVHWRLLTQVNSIALIPQRLAWYRQHPSATTANKGLKRADYFIVLDQVEDFLRDSGLFETYSDTLTAQQLNAYYGVHDVISPEFHPKVICMIEERLTERHRDYLRSDKPMRWQARAFFRALEGNAIAGGLLAARNAIRLVYRTVRSGT